MSAPIRPEDADRLLRPFNGGYGKRQTEGTESTNFEWRETEDLPPRRLPDPVTDCSDPLQIIARAIAGLGLREIERLRQEIDVHCQPVRHSASARLLLWALKRTNPTPRFEADQQALLESIQQPAPAYQGKD